jgi:hypothetical protein
VPDGADVSGPVSLVDEPGEGRLGVLDLGWVLVLRRAAELFSGARRKSRTSERTPVDFAMCAAAFRSECIEATTVPPMWKCRRACSVSAPSGMHHSASTPFAFTSA